MDRQERSEERNHADMRGREREERREYVKERRRKRDQRIENTEVPLEKPFGDMDNNPVVDEFALLGLQRNMRRELGDSRVKLTQAVTEGRVNLEVKEDAVTNILDQLRGQKTWSHEKELMEKEICALKDQLTKAQSNIQSRTDTEELTSQVQILCKKLSLTLDDLDAQKSYSKRLEERIQSMREHSALKMVEEARYVDSLRAKAAETLKIATDDLEDQIAKTKDVQDKLEKVEVENKNLKEEVKAMELEVHAAKQLQTLAEHSTKIAVQSLEVQLFDKDAEVFVARSKAEQLEADLVFQKSQVQKLQERLGKKTEALQKQKEDAKKAAERTQTYHRLQTDEHKAETRKVAFALKKAEDLLVTERLCWRQEKSSLLEERKKQDEAAALLADQLDKQKHENDALLSALRSAEQELQDHQIEWQELKTSLIQTSEDLKKTLQVKEEEWGETKSSMKAQLEDLINKKKKKKKWFRKLF
ncbi:golgin subfamily A member 6-like protein 6 [Acanthopagrus latus]|uniref:golgin subfamily A member 6-like protein 6 n=1 Tax=Acanthopagrus latus TaxID=8177 RepID=UPI00187C6E02|nr:golgin subfamily A member 6-like protein 6 [Acanthopagrus latus]